MSFIGKATYAELYPSRSPDGARLDDRYEYGSVIRTKIYGDILLIQIAEGVIAVSMNNGNHWNMEKIPETNRIDYKRTCSGNDLRIKFGEFEFLGMINNFVFQLPSEEDA